MRAALVGFVAKHLAPRRLFVLSVAALPPEAPETWIFLALQRDPETDGFREVAGPALAQPSRETGRPAFRQMLSFVSPRGVIPPRLTRNLAPVACLTNGLRARLGVPAREGEGVSTSPLFESNDAAEAQRVGLVIADPTRAHFFNTDCVSCRIETRREIDAAGPAGAGAHETVVRRTARETAEVVDCLNHGDWRNLDALCVPVAPATPLEQGWDRDLRALDAHTSQGSAVMPLAYLLALAQPDGPGRFADPANPARYGFLRSDLPVNTAEAARLPVGMTVTERDGARHVGLNCAACHTADVIAGDRRLRVEGAPSALDFDRFAIDLADAMRRTAQLDPETRRPTDRFRAFITAVALIETDRVRGREAAFVEEVLAFAAAFSGGMALRRPAFEAGPGRVDALTQILNALAVTDVGLPPNHSTPTEPTSYPALWLAPRLEYVQWNLAVSDPLTRNVGQALGVFGRAELLGGQLFASRADIPALEANKRWLERLRPPPRPEADLGPIDTARAEAGRDLFRAQCRDCHNAPPSEPTKPEDNAAGDTFIKVTAVPAAKLGTDPAYTRAFTERWVSVPPLSDKLDLPGATVPGALYLATVVNVVTDRALSEKADRLGMAAGPSDLKRQRPGPHADCQRRDPENLRPHAPCNYLPPLAGAGLKAGPLVGLWATGP